MNATRPRARQNTTPPLYNEQRGRRGGPSTPTEWRGQGRNNGTDHRRPSEPVGDAESDCGHGHAPPLGCRVGWPPTYSWDAEPRTEDSGRSTFLADLPRPQGAHRPHLRLPRLAGRP